MRGRLGILVAVTGVFVTALMGPVTACLDVGTPPGLPTEWIGGLMTPVTTDVGKVPQPVTTPDRMRGNRETVVAGPPRMVAIPAQGLYGYFNIGTPDLVNHINYRSPEIQRAPNQGPVITGPENFAAFAYPPVYPTELVWDGLCTALRLQLHPEIISETGSMAHLLALGEPAVLGIDIAGTAELRDWATRIIGNMAPGYPEPPINLVANSFDRMLARLATRELVNGFPYMLDPNYCRRILSLEAEAVPALTACARSSHPFLRRNAAGVIGSLGATHSRDILRALAGHADLVVAVRALRGLGDHADASNADFFARLLAHREPVIQSMACYGLGRCRGIEAPSALRNYFLRAIDPLDRERLWDALPALARLGGTDRTVSRRLEELLKFLAQRFPAENAPIAAKNPRFDTALFPERMGYHHRVLWEMVLMAAATFGSAEARAELLALSPLTEINRVNWYLYIDTLARLGGDDAITMLQAFGAYHRPDGRRPFGFGVGMNQEVSDIVVSHIVRTLFRMGVSTAWFAELALNDPRPVVRTHALIVLAQRNANHAKQICAELIEKLPIPSLFAPDETRRQQNELRAIIAEIIAEPNWMNDSDLYRRLNQAQNRLLNLNTTPNGSWNSLPARAYFYTTVLSIGGALGAFTYDQLFRITRHVVREGMHAQRVGENSIYLYPDIQVFPPLVETAVFELGRTADVRALPLLIEILNAQLPYGSPEAAIVLGNFRYRAAISALLDALSADNGWIRFCAYRALRQISGSNFFADWINGTPQSTASAIRQYRAWYDKTFNPR